MKVALFLLLSVLAIASAADTRVRYVHLAMTGQVTEMNVAWYTQDGTSTSTVQFDTQPNLPFRNSAQGTSNEWSSGYGHNHFVTLTGLRAGQVTHYYRCGDASGGWSDVFSFVTPPLDGTNKSFTIAVYGDMGIDNSANTARRVNNLAANDQFAWVYHVGDISYADDHVFEFQDTWNTWFEMMENTTSIKPYMVLPGNHEYGSYDPFLFFQTRNFVVYNHRFMMPGAANSARKNMYYSFDYANVHFVSISTETSFTDAPFGDDFGDQLTWLEEDLKQANANREKHPWIIVGGHRPIYSSSSGYSENGVPVNNWIPPSNSLTLQQLFEDLFTKYDVDLIFTGHVHSYERNYPAYKNKRTGGYVQPPNPIGVVLGNAGNIEGLEDENKNDWTWPEPEWSAFRYGLGYGYGMLNVVNNTYLNWQFIDAASGNVLDQFSVLKKH